jgi:hypothetical protein
MAGVWKKPRWRGDRRRGEARRGLTAGGMPEEIRRRPGGGRRLLEESGGGSGALSGRRQRVERAAAAAAAANPRVPPRGLKTAWKQGIGGGSEGFGPWNPPVSNGPSGFCAVSGPREENPLKTPLTRFYQTRPEGGHRIGGGATTRTEVDEEMDAGKTSTKPNHPQLATNESLCLSWQN